jgi:hypothetical protein
MKEYCGWMPLSFSSYTNIYTPASNSCLFVDAPTEIDLVESTNNFSISILYFEKICDREFYYFQQPEKNEWLVGKSNTPFKCMQALSGRC